MGAQLRLVRRRSAPATSTLLRSQSSPASPDMEAEQPSCVCFLDFFLHLWPRHLPAPASAAAGRRAGCAGAAPRGCSGRRRGSCSQLVGRALHSRSSGPCGDMAALLVLAALIRRLLLILLGGGWRCCHQLLLPHGSGGGGALSTGRSSQFHHCHPLNQVSSWIPIANSISFYVCLRVV